MSENSKPISLGNATLLTLALIFFGWVAYKGLSDKIAARTMVKV